MATTTPDLDRRFHALSDEKRLRVLELLREGERCVCELTDAIDASQSLLSFHLKTLRDAGLVADRREGRWVYYSLDPSALAAMRDFLGGLAAGAGEGTGWTDGSRAGPAPSPAAGSAAAGSVAADPGGRRTCC